ncbi:MAG: hypothetical protein NT062_08570 [Proteobacteria bacterium]|nr:hypothetical protein [Pseudomonadota bacterium]
MALVAIPSCGSKRDDKPRVKGNVARVEVLAKFMIDNVPRPGVAPDCKDEDYVGGYPLTHLTLLKLGKGLYKEDAEHADWINPAQLDAPSARVLLDPKASADDKAYAAGEFTNAKFFVVYRVENADAPMALGVKDPKISTISTKIIKYGNRDQPGKETIPVCARAFSFQNTKEKSDWAIEKSDKALIDPVVAAAMRDDLTARWLELAPKVTPKSR